MTGMQDVPLGSSGMMVSPIGVGTNRWGVSDLGQPAFVPVFEEAISLGLTLFDTAEVYGFGGSERTLGYCIQSSGKLPILATKFFPLPWRWKRSTLLGALRRSLSRLGVPQVDLYMVHFPFPPVPVEVWAAALADAVHEGLARSVGVSNFSAAQLRKAYDVLKAFGVPLACNEVEYSLLNRRVERKGMLAMCRDLGITLLAYRPLALGFLPGSHGRTNLPKGWRGMEAARLYPQRFDPVTDVLRRLGEAHGGKTPAQVSLNWIMRKGALPIAGARSVAHLRENAGALGWQLSDGEVKELDQAEEKLRRE